MQHSPEPHPAGPAGSKVAILLATHNGQRFLAEQLDSYAAQRFDGWHLYASDDGSVDDTRQILAAYRSRWGAEKLSISAGPQRGFVANFLGLACNPMIEEDFFAFSDQDDVWYPEKLERAVAWLQTIPVDTPALYCSTSRLVDESGAPIGLSPRFPKPPRFANALVQNIASGNTMVFNNAARAILRAAGTDVDVVVHDWWVYQVVSGCGGEVCYDPRPGLDYRQHGRNLIGANTSWADRMQRIRSYWQGHFRDWSDRNIQALQRIRQHLTPTALSTLDRFAAARRHWWLPRLILLARSGVYRQTLAENVTLFAAALLRRI